ncbi:MAG: DEAD/DEAH box helicase [Candidatus Tectomicrobia bacterium]|uniref:DEAD-box ATP-dependent RNA helicase RhpA n=1 Tax=Tectimicrobiota bacterium TaxID=2528274 RepID=A0A938B268_UNCTE|nr:DEAD/DEAH box helicase [Candidatus Tectomicrobia bacterium]
MTTAFATLGLCPGLLQTVAELGYTQPTPIQAGAIPVLLTGCDVLGQARTGTGKTAAFALPMLQRIDLQESSVQGVVLAPTRELAIQVADAIYRYGHRLGGRVLPVYGGQPYARQQRRLAQGVPIVVGTPGRMLDLLRQGALDLSQVRYLVLDEADAMLQMGFLEDVEALMQATPVTRQTTLFSATLSPAVRHIATRYMREPLTVAIDEDIRTVPQTTQRYYLIQESAKVAALTLLLEVEPIQSALIFTRTRVGTAELADTLVARGYAAEALHGDLSQAARETVLRRFRHGRITLLVATDVGARGLDIADVSHVINFDMPFDVTDYVHRIGRTGRAGRTGAEVAAQRDARFKRNLDTILTTDNLSHELMLVTELAASADVDIARLAAAAIRLARAPEQARPIEVVRDIQPTADRPTPRQARPTERGSSRTDSRTRRTGQAGPPWHTTGRVGRLPRRTRPAAWEERRTMPDGARS